MTQRPHEVAEVTIFMQGGQPGRGCKALTVESLNLLDTTTCPGLAAVRTSDRSTEGSHCWSLR